MYLFFSHHTVAMIIQQFVSGMKLFIDFVNPVMSACNLFNIFPRIGAIQSTLVVTRSVVKIK